MKKSSKRIYIVFVTVAKKADAIRMSRVAVEKKLAACATVLPPVRSDYKWKGKLVQGREILVLFKTTHARYPALEKTIKALHDYEVPEIIAVSVVEGHLPYLEWVSKEVGK